MTRKIIQIDTIVAADTGDEIPMALCDDGTVWFLYRSVGWRKAAGIPQGPSENYELLEREDEGS